MESEKKHPPVSDIVCQQRKQHVAKTKEKTGTRCGEDCSYNWVEELHPL
jgi:hypothetical protein